MGLIGGNKDFRLREHPSLDCSPPDTVENITIGKDSDVEVGRQNGVKPPDLLVPEESVRHPDLAGIRDGEVGDLV